MADLDTVPPIELNDGHELPSIGFGTYPLKGEQAVAVIGDAIAAGYQLIDTATRYDNEAEVGRAIAAADVPREELFVTTKLPGASHGYAETLIAFDDLVARLGLDYVDLYLIHWPLPRIDRFVETWQAFIELRERGQARSIGVSNFTPIQIDRLIDETGVTPAVNQIELHPQLPQAEQRAYDRDHAIVTQSWSPLGRDSNLLDSSVIARIADAHEATPAQVVLRWHHEIGACPIPKSSNPERLRANLDIFGFELSEDEVSAIGTLATGVRLGGDPDSHEEF